MKQIKATKFVSNKLATIFLCGSIEMGKAEQWQEKVVEMLKDTHWTILNPRRDDWDNTWKQEIGYEPFFEQVSWELQGLETCEKAIVYFAPESKAPITLLEFGLLSQLKEPQDVLVVCPEEFYRKGNVDIVCDRYRIKQYKTLTEACATLKEESLSNLNICKCEPHFEMPHTTQSPLKAEAKCCCECTYCKKV